MGGMPRAEILSKQAVYTLGLLHAELAGKLLANKREAIRLRTAMMQVEAVVKMLQPGFNVATIAAKRRNKSNPWFKRGTLFRSAVDVLRRSAVPMTAREIAETLIAGKDPEASRSSPKTFRRLSLPHCGSATGRWWLGSALRPGGRLGLRSLLSCNRACQQPGRQP
jgi:hypothetical protein